MNPSATSITSLNDLEFVDLAAIPIDPKWASVLPASAARRQRALPLCQVDGVVIIGTSNPNPAEVERLVASHLKQPFQLVRVDEQVLRHFLGRIASQVSGPRVGDSTDAGEVVEVCDELLAAAALRNASDMHFMPTDKQLQISFRADGMLEDFRSLPMSLHAGLINRLKVMAGLNIAEKREPQDGRFTLNHASLGQRMDVRVATIPTRFGERATLRLLKPLEDANSFASLGMNPKELETFDAAIRCPSGLILLTGPTGSGKSTTLYTAIKQLQLTRGGNIITLEDPVEYDIPGTSQIEVDAAAKVTFARALRSILRHDPDVIMLGEIRDAETAELAIKASLTGHLVLSTLHTNTAAGVVTRLLDLGVQPYLIAATLRLGVAQRLVRHLCPYCRLPTKLAITDALALGQPELAGCEVFESAGCVYCSGKGFWGRLGLFEMLRGGGELSQLIAAGAREDTLVEHMRKSQHTQLIEDGIRKMRAGLTTVQQVLSAVSAW